MTATNPPLPPTSQQPHPDANALERQQRQFQNLLNAVNGIVWEADAATMRFTFVSDKAEEIVGYPARRWVEEPTFWIDHLHPDDREWAMRFCVDHAAARQDHELDYRMLTPSGSTVWLRETVTVVVDADDTVHLRGVIVDISRQKAVEAELARRDAILEAVRFAGERLLAAGTSWSDSISEVLQRLGHAAGVSRVYIFENYLGPDGTVWARNTNEWVSAPSLSVIDRPQLQAFSYGNMHVGHWPERLARGEVIFSHVRDLPADQRAEFEDEGTLSFVLVPIFVDDAWWGFIGFDECRHERNSSKTERDALQAAAGTLGAAIARSRADEELRESQRSLQTLMSNLPGMAYRSTPGSSWTIEFVSEGALGLTGYHPADLIGSGDRSFLRLIHPDDRPGMRQDIEAAIAEQRPYHLNYRITAADGSERWLMEQGRPVLDPSGEVVALEGIIMDVTDRIQLRHNLEQRVTERTRELATLLSVSSAVASTLELRPLMGVILNQLRQVVDHVAAAIFSLDGDVLHLLDYRGPTDRSELDWVWSLSQAAHSRAVIERREPLIIPDVRADTFMAAAFRQKAIDDLGEVPAYISSWMGVPLMHRERAIGLLAVDSGEVGAYTEHHAELALAFASQAAIAIENARLYEEAAGKAALEERQRLARELHDSVSQALFGIGLGARTARTLIDRDPAKAVQPIEYVLSLAEAGLTEMRALIFELRPEALEQEGLSAALDKQVAAMRSRYGIQVEAQLPDSIDPAPPVQEAIYRIAQEALHNIVKHARAKRVDVRLETGDGVTTLSVADDGVGFDTAGSFPGHLGLTTMCERAEKLGGTLTIESAPGKGSRITVSIPSPRI